MDHRLRAVLTVVVLTVVGLLLLPAPQALAHAELIETSPANGTHLDAAPSQVTLRFTETVNPVRNGFRVLDDRGETVASPSATRAPGDDALISLPMPADLGDGVYVVSWRVVSADSHPIHGAFVFSVGDAQAAPLADAGAQAGSSGPVEVAFWLFRLLSFASLALVVGGGLFVVLCWRGGLADHRVRRVIAVGWAVALVSAAGMFLLQGPNVAGTSLAGMVDPALLADTAGTTFGVLLLVRIGLLVLAGVLLARLRTVSRRELVLVAVLGFALALTWSGTGHAAAGMLSTLAVVLDATHLAAMSAWLGGLAVLATCTLGRVGRDREEEATVAVSRFSSTAAVSVVVLGVTGLLQAWRQLAEFGPGTEYFTLLIFKVAVFGLLLWLASLSRSYVRRRLLAPGTTRKAAGRRDTLAGLRRSVAWEAGIAVVVLGITAALVTIPPGGHDHGPSAAAATPAGPYLGSLALPDSGDVQVWVNPARTGDNQIVLNVRDRSGINRNVPEVTAELRLPEVDLGPLPVTLDRTGPGQFVADKVVVPVAGAWTLDLTVRTTEFEKVSVDTTISMR